MARPAEAGHIHFDSGPSLRTVDFEKNAGGSAKTLLTDEQRQQLTALATLMSLPPRSIVYREESDLAWIFIARQGVLKAFRQLPSGKRRVAAFLFPGDVFGLAENGHYVNTVQTITSTVLYRIPTDALAELLRRDPDLQFQFLAKITHEIRQGQRHAIVLARRDAAGRFAMFLSMLEKNQLTGSRGGWIELPMSRTDLAEYLGLSLESVSRATAALTRRGLVEFEGGHAAKVVDRARFEKLVNTL
jgi:CRP/FNR family transcriptional regulator, anaerobic regulatory protein